MARAAKYPSWKNCSDDGTIKMMADRQADNAKKQEHFSSIWLYIWSYHKVLQCCWVCRIRKIIFSSLGDFYDLPYCTTSVLDGGKKYDVCWHVCTYNDIINHCPYYFFYSFSVWVCLLLYLSFLIWRSYIWSYIFCYDIAKWNTIMEVPGKTGLNIKVEEKG